MRAASGNTESDAEAAHDAEPDITIDVARSKPQTLVLVENQLVAQLRLINSSSLPVGFQIGRSTKWSDGTQIPSGWFSFTIDSGQIAAKSSKLVSLRLHATSPLDATFRIMNASSRAACILKVRHPSASEQEVGFAEARERARAMIRNAPCCSASELEAAVQSAVSMGLPFDEARRRADDRCRAEPRTSSGAPSTVVDASGAQARLPAVTELTAWRERLRLAAREQRRDDLLSVLTDPSAVPCLVRLLGKAPMEDVRRSLETSLDRTPATLSTTCTRGLALYAQGELLKAISAFNSAPSASTDAAPPSTEALLATLCKSMLGVELDDESRRVRDGARGEEDGLSKLVLASVLDAEAGVSGDASKTIVGRALAFLADPVSVQLLACQPVAYALILKHEPGLGRPAESATRGVADELTEERRLAAKADTPAMKRLWEMTGILPVKKACMEIKDNVELSRRRGEDLKKKNYHAIFTGNPGTGKTTVARHYGAMLKEIGILPGDGYEETSGAKLLADGVAKLKDLLKKLENGGLLFVDESYQLQPKKNQTGAGVLDLLLTEMENLRGKLVVVFAGYEKPMEELISYNEGLPSRFPFRFAFPDFTEEELRKILTDTIQNEQVTGGPFTVEDAKHVRIAARRLAAQRGTTGFANARAVRNMWQLTLRRQSSRIIAEEAAGGSPSVLRIKREDLLGPREVRLATRAAIDALNAMRGLAGIKENVESLLQLIETNVELEEQEKPPQQVALNRIFIGNPGTGKTTVAKIYGAVLKSLGLLSKGDVLVRNPADFIGAALGQSDERTKSILSNAMGSVLVIDEAYGLHVAEGSADPYKKAVIDTIVAEVQGVPGDDRCVLLLGYPEEMRLMMESNAGLARRFQFDDPFYFEDYSDEDLLFILKQQAQDAGWAVGFDVLEAAVAVLAKQRMKPRFGNGGAVANLLSQAKTRYEMRMKAEGRNAAERANNRTLKPVDFDSEADEGAAQKRQRKIDGLFSDLIGCHAVLEKLREMKDTIAFAEQRGRSALEVVDHGFVFAGPPGTGKTTVARRMGELYHSLQLLPSPEVVECSANDLIAGYTGQTRSKTRKVFESALGKVLFVDEACMHYAHTACSFP